MGSRCGRRPRRIWFGAAVKRCQATDERFPRVTVHELRHTAASLMITSGANVKMVQAQLGHKSATMTLDQYGHLFPDDLDDVANKMDEPFIRVRPQRKRARAKIRSDLLSNRVIPCGAAGNRTRVLRHSLKASPCAVR